MDSEAGAAWNYGEATEDSLIEHPSTFSNEPPLQFAALFAQSQPEDGKVSLGQLGAILNRSLIPNEKVSQILEYSTDAGSTKVTEKAFYWALHQAASVQADEMHTIFPYDDDAVPDFNKALNLQDESQMGEQIFKQSIPDYNPTAEPQIHLSISSKNAGSYLFKHAVYSLDGEVDGKTVKVLRRYRDFATFVDFLSRRFPFRVIPMLPPKRITVNGKYLVGENQDVFLTRRAAGLERFINLLVQHPVIGKDPLVSEFLFDLAYYPTKPLADELDGKIADPLFISQWTPENAKQWASTELATEDSLNQITSMCVLCEKQLKRMISEQADSEVLGNNFAALSRNLFDIYPSMQNDLPSIQQRLEHGTQFAEATHKNLITSRKVLNSGPLEQLKLYREMLSSILGLFKRIRSMGGNNIPDLKKKISATQRKLVAASTKEDAKEDDLHKLRMIIQTAQNSIREQTNRDWQIKMVVTQELLIIQTMQYQLSKFLRSLASFVSDDLARRTEIANYFTDSAESSPLKPEST